MSENVNGRWAISVYKDEWDALLAKRDALREAGEGLLRIVVDEYGDPAEDEDVADLSWLDAAVSAWRAATSTAWST